MLCSLSKWNMIMINCMVNHKGYPHPAIYLSKTETACKFIGYAYNKRLNGLTCTRKCVAYFSLFALVVFIKSFFETRNKTQFLPSCTVLLTRVDVDANADVAPDF